MRTLCLCSLGGWDWSVGGLLDGGSWIGLLNVKRLLETGPRVVDPTEI